MVTGSIGIPGFQFILHPSAFILSFCVAVSEESKHQIAVLDHLGTLQRRIITGTTDCATGDVDGDGRAELLHVHDGKLEAIERGGEVRWAWPSACEHDSAQVPLGLATRGEGNSSPHIALAQLATSTTERTVSRAIVPAMAEAAGSRADRSQRAQILASSPQFAPPPDPRLTRRLPWVPVVLDRSKSRWPTGAGMLAGVFLFLGLYTLTVVVLPGRLAGRADRAGGRPPAAAAFGALPVGESAGRAPAGHDF